MAIKKNLAIGKYLSMGKWSTDFRGNARLKRPNISKAAGSRYDFIFQAPLQRHQIFTLSFSEARSLEYE